MSARGDQWAGAWQFARAQSSTGPAAARRLARAGVNAVPAERSARRDHGGMLSHGAIVARELGLPCVCGTTDASRRIADGQQIQVDGDRGTVEVLS